jgi:hypothetical protein
MAAPIERIEVVEIRPGDIVVLHVPEPRFLTEEQRIEQFEATSEQWRAATGLDNRIVIVSGGIRIEIERPVGD